MGTKEPVLEVPFAGGIDEATRDEVADASGSFALLENGRRDRRVGYTKRLGYTSLSAARIDATTRSAGRKLVSHDGTVCTVDGTYLDVYSETLGVSVVAGRVPEALGTVLDSPAITASGSRVVDIAYCNGVVVVAQSDGTNTYLTVQDVDGAQLIDPHTISSAVYGGLATYGDVVVCFTTTGTSANIGVQYLDCTSASTLYSIGWAMDAFPATDKLATGAAGAKVVATQSLTDRVALAYVNNSGGASQLTVKTWTVASGVVETLTVSTSGATPSAVALGGSSADTLWVAWNQTTTVYVRGVSAASLSTTLATEIGVAAVGVAPTTIAIGSGHAPGAGRLFLNLVAEVYTQSFVTSGGAVAADGVGASLPYVILLTRPILQGSRYFAACCQLYDVSQTTADFVLCDLTEAQPLARPVASVEPRLVIPSDGYGLPNVVGIGSSKYLTPVHLLRSGAVRATVLVEYDFASAARWQSVYHAGSTYFSGGILTKFDGTRLREVGFLASPYTPSASAAAGTLTSSNGGFRYVTTYEVADGDGNWVVSGVSLPSSATGNLATKIYTVTSSALCITSRYDAYAAATQSRVGFYRTTDGGSTYFYVDSVPNNPTVQPSITDELDDTTLQSRAKLLGNGQYPGTPGAPQDRRAPPGLPHLVSYNDMLVGATGSTLWYSSQPVVGEGVWFNPLFRLDMVDGGDVTGLATQDGTLYVFKRRRVFAVAGEAPADNGGSGGLGTPRRLAVDVGCIEPRSLVVTALGIFFQSERGIELLGRGQSVEWVGESVRETLASYPVITSATLDSALGLVRFTCAATETANAVGADGVHLVFDLAQKQWVSRDTVYGSSASQAAQSATMVQVGGEWRYAWLASGGTVYLERLASDASAHLDGSTWVTQRAATMNVHLSGLQGEQNIDRILVLAERHTDHDFTIEVAHDYAGSYTESKTFSAALLATLGRQWLDRELVKSTGQAVQVRISDATPSSGTVGTGKGATWVALTFSGERRSGARRTTSAERGT